MGRSMDLDAITPFSDSLLVVFSVTSRSDKPKIPPSWSIFLVLSSFWESLHNGRSCDKFLSCASGASKVKCLLQFHIT